MPQETDRSRMKTPRLVTAWRLCWSAGRGLVLCLCACSLVTGPVAATVTWATKLMVDGLVSHRSGSILAFAVGALAVSGLIGTCVPNFMRYVAGELSRRITVMMSDRLYSAVGSFRGLARFEDPHTLDQIRSAQESTSIAIEPTTIGLFGVVTDALSLAALLIAVWMISPPMTVVLVLAAVPVLLSQLALSRRYARTVRDTSAMLRQHLMFTALSTDLRAVKESRLFGMVDFFKHRMLRALTSTNSVERDMDRRELRVQTRLSLLSTLIASGGTAWAVYASYRGELSVGDVSAFVVAVAAASGTLAGIAGKISEAYHALILLDYYLEVVDKPPDLDLSEGGEELPPLGSGIELDDLWFRYADSHPWVLQGVSLTIGHGESVALVGLNGAGKSTLIKLLCRFYDPTHGVIRWDGVDIRTVPVHELRERIGVLFQDFMEYDLTAEENIGIGDISQLAVRQRIADAAARAGIDEKIRSLPSGYETLLTRLFFSDSEKEDPENGVELSGGQWQRVALARTFMRADCDLLILDEPSAGLDAESEHQIAEGIRAYRAGRTSLLVSHRLSAVRDADRIIVLAAGQIAETGTHEELMRTGGRYANLFTLQAKGYQEKSSTLDQTCSGPGLSAVAQVSNNYS